MKNIIGTKYNIWIYTKNEDLTNERLVYSFVNFEKSNKTVETFFYLNPRYTLQRIKKDRFFTYVNKSNRIDKEKYIWYKNNLVKRIYKREYLKTI